MGALDWTNNSRFCYFNDIIVIFVRFSVSTTYSAENFGNVIIYQLSNPIVVILLNYIVTVIRGTGSAPESGIQ